MCHLILISKFAMPDSIKNAAKVAAAGMVRYYTGYRSVRDWQFAFIALEEAPL